MMDISEFLFSFGPQKIAKIERACGLREDVCKQYVSELKDRQFIRKNADDEFELIQGGIDFLGDTLALYHQHFPERRKAIEEGRFWRPVARIAASSGETVQLHEKNIAQRQIQRISSSVTRQPTKDELRPWLETKFQSIETRFNELEKFISENKQTKIRKAWFRTLLGMTELGGRTGTEELADHLKISRSVISEYLNRMEEEGIVKRTFSDDSTSGSKFVWQIDWNSLPPDIASRLRK